MRAMTLIEPAKPEHHWRLRFYDNLNLFHKLTLPVKGRGAKYRAQAEAFERSIRDILTEQAAPLPVSDDSRRFLDLNPQIALKLRQWGIIDAATVAVAEPLSAIAEKWNASRKARNLSHNTLVRTERVIKEAIEGCGWKYVSDINAADLLTFYQQAGKTPNTTKNYIHDCKNFCNWLVDAGYVAVSPLAKIQMPKVKTKLRANIELPQNIEDQLVKHLSASTKKRVGATPGERILIYALASKMGLRENETIQLELSDLHLDATTPYIAIDRLKVKSDKSASAIPIPATLLPELRAQASKAKDGRLFPMLCKDCDLAKLLRQDLVDAGLQTGDGKRNYTYHGLRHTCASRLARQKDPALTPAELQNYMRHEDIKMTMQYYVHVNLEQLGNRGDNGAEAMEGIKGMEGMGGGEKG